MTGEQNPHGGTSNESEANDHADDASTQEGEDQQNTAEHTGPRDHERMIGDTKFYCVPWNPNAGYDPCEGRDFTDEHGDKYWCIPYDKWYKFNFAPRYNSQVKIDPDLID
jgi:hypothetical protein